MRTLAVVVTVLTLTAFARSGMAADPEVQRDQNRKGAFSGVLAFDLPLNRDDETAGAGTQGDFVLRSPTISATINYRPAGALFARTTLYGYFDRSRQQPWNPDFTYAFGYEDWRPNTFSAVYENYNGNRFSPDEEKGERITRFEEGTIRASYRMNVPDWIERIFVVHPGDRMSATISALGVPRYTRADATERGRWKKALSLDVNTRPYRNFTVSTRFFYYPDRKQRQPWDPDFTYGFGWSDYRPGSFSVQYNNYSGNRYSAGERAPNTGRFSDGSLSILYNWAWR